MLGALASCVSAQDVDSMLLRRALLLCQDTDSSVRQVAHGTALVEYCRLTLEQRTVVPHKSHAPGLTPVCTCHRAWWQHCPPSFAVAAAAAHVRRRLLPWRRSWKP